MTELWSEVVATRPETTRVPPDAAIAKLAARQHGVVARRQLWAIGVTRATLRARLAAGTLIAMHSGVYAVGHRQLRIEGHRLAAVLWAGPGAALSHRDAAALHALRPSSRARIDVTTARRLRCPPPGIDVHHSASLDARDVTTVDGIAVTTVARTLVDLADVAPRDRVAKALREAERLRVLDAAAIEDVLRRTRNRPGPGHARLRVAIGERRRRGLQLTRSVLEDRFLALCETHGLPRPSTNAHADGQEVDAFWPSRRLVVELDGWARHKDRHAFQRDRSKGNALTQAGFPVLRFTHDDVVRRPDVTAAQIHALLADA